MHARVFELFHYRRHTYPRSLSCNPFQGTPMPPKKTYENGIRIQLKGHHTTADWRAMLNEMVDQVEAVGVTHIKNTNVYSQSGG